MIPLHYLLPNEEKCVPLARSHHCNPPREPPPPGSQVWSRLGPLLSLCWIRVSEKQLLIRQ